MKLLQWLLLGLEASLISDSLYCLDPIRGTSVSRGLDESRVVGGTNAAVHTWKWIVKIDIGCGGSIIHPNYILTAGHCCYTTNPKYLRFHYKAYDLANPGKGVQTRLPTKVIRHPAYDSRTLNNDICLLYIQDPIKFDEDTAPVCLPPAYKWANVIPGGTKCFIAGWGRTKENGAISPILQELMVPIIDHQTCSRKDVYGNDIIRPTMMCAGYLEGGKDGCQGDSGGPLICIEDDQPVLRGVVSWGIGCARPKSPGVYARTASYREWIIKEINKREESEAQTPAPSEFLSEQVTVTTTDATTSTEKTTKKTTTTTKRTTTSTEAKTTKTSTTTTTTSTTITTTTTTTTTPDIKAHIPDEYKDVEGLIDDDLYCLEDESNKSRIFSGSIAAPNTWKWLVRLDYGRYGCSGSILHNHWVLTAGECCPPNLHSFPDFNFKLKVYDLSYTAAEVIINPDQVIRHPGYNEITMENNLCLIYTKNRIEFDEATNNICLPSRSETPLAEGDECFVAGWGEMNQNRKDSNVLHELAVPIMDFDKCNAVDAYNGFLNYMSDQVFCGGSLQGSAGTCQGDTGGPLMCIQDGRPVLRGIVNWGYGCSLENMPGVYTNISKFSSWIKLMIMSKRPYTTTTRKTTTTTTTTRPTTKSTTTTTTRRTWFSTKSSTRATTTKRTTTKTSTTTTTSTTKSTTTTTTTTTTSTSTTTTMTTTTTSTSTTTTMTTTTTSTSTTTTTTTSTSTSTKVTTSSSTTATTSTSETSTFQTFNYNRDCKAVKDLPIFFNGRKMSYIQQRGPNFMTVRYNYLNVGDGAYTGFMSFNRDSCGADFVRGMSDGRIQIAFSDESRNSNQNLYKPSYKYVGSSMKANSDEEVFIQFSGYPSVATRTQRKDFVYVSFFGLKNVQLKSSDVRQCLARSNTMYMDGILEDITMCMVNRPKRFSKLSAASRILT